MKKFKFTLESLKKYNEQILDSEKNQLGRLRAELAEKEANSSKLIAKAYGNSSKLFMPSLLCGQHGAPAMKPWKHRRSE